MYLLLPRGVAQLVAQRFHNPRVAGSSPASATNDRERFHGWILQKRLAVAAYNLSSSATAQLFCMVILIFLLLALLIGGQRMFQTETV